MAQSNYKFERIEKKFWMSREQYEALFPILEANMERDAYGQATICNIYYDTPEFYLIQRSIERPYFKEKLRMRSYGIPRENDPVFVEIKRKLDGIGYKRRLQVPFYQAKKLVKGEPIGSDDPQVEAEILEFVRRYHPEPKVFLTYRRFALYGKEDPNFRVTIDRDLKYRDTDVETPGEFGTMPIMQDPTRVLMEIKAMDAIPDWLLEPMNRLHIYQAPFSKIGTCYTERIAPKEAAARAAALTSSSQS